MSLQELQWGVAILVGLTILAGAGFGVVKFFVKAVQEWFKWTSLHPRLDRYFRENDELKVMFVREMGVVNKQIGEIKVFLRVHPTLRFRMPESHTPAAPAGSHEQDIFPPGDQG